jgi:5,10-methylenetetrahydromethanopterin reductase
VITLDAHMIQLSFGVAGGKPAQDYVALAKVADDFGFHTMSIFDDLMFKPAWPLLFLIAPHVTRMRLGPSVCNPYLIHPAILAENAAVLDEVCEGRGYFGIGRGAFLDFVNTASRAPLSAVREAIELARHLWRGEAAPYQGTVFQTTAHATLQWRPPRAEIPVMVGTWGPKMARMAGMLADEVKAGSMWSASYGRMLADNIAAGAREAGRDPARIGLVFGPLTAISEDAAEARAQARRTLAFYLPYLAPMPAHAGMDEAAVARVQAATSRGDIEGAVANISDDVLRQFALFGTPHDVIAEIERMISESPVTRIEFGMPHGPQGSAAALRLLGREVLPHFARSVT